MKNLINNIEKIHTTELGEIRIRKNLKLAESDDVVAICKEHVKNPDAKIVKDGKNYYVEFSGNLYTINGFNYCIITAKKGKYQKKAEETGFLHHVCIQTNSYADSKAFYMKVLGMNLVEETPNFHGRDFNTWLKLGSFMIELQTPKTGKVFSPIDNEHEGISHLCLWVDDIDAEFARINNAILLESLGQMGEKGLYQVNNGRLFKITAPEGTIIEFRNIKGC